MPQKHKLYIKNMVCPRCITVVKNELEDLGYTIQHIDLGEVELSEQPDIDKVKSRLEKNGFELLEDKNRKLVEKIKKEIIQIIQNTSFNHEKLSYFLAEKIGVDYAQLSTLFSSLENTTIEKYYILQRIEKVKELLVYDELSLKEIAFQLSFSSVAHLSAQFKKITGLTPGYFKKIGVNRRNHIDSI